MQIIKDIKIERLLLALGITLLIADTVPHPHLSAGLVEHTLHRVQAGLIQGSSTAGAIAGINASRTGVLRPCTQPCHLSTHKK